MVADTIALDERAQRAIGWLTTERAVYGLIVVAGVGARLWGLGAAPLTPGEAMQALPAAQAVAGTQPDLAGLSPLLYTLQRLAFTLFGAGDASARFWPALIGGLSPLLFFALRERLTRGGALVGAALWALSPLAVWSSRFGAGDSLVPPLALALLAVLAQRVEGGKRWAVYAAAVLGLLLVAGRNGYIALLAFSVAALLAGYALDGPVRALSANRRAALVAFAAAVLAGSTFFMLTPFGVSSAVGLAGEWVLGLLPGGGEYAAWEVVYRLVMSEFALLAFGIAGTVWALRRGDRFGVAVSVATGLAWLLSIASRGRHPLDLALVALGLALLAGPTVARILRGARSWLGSRDSWILVGVSGALLFAAFLAFPGAWNPNNREDWRAIYTGIFIATSALFLVIWLAYGIWDSWSLVARTLPLVLFAFAFAWQLSQVAALSYDRGAWRQPGVVYGTPATDLADFRDALRNLSALNRGGPDDAGVDLVWPERPDDPALALLRWELRDFDNLRVGASLPDEPAGIVITPVEDQPRLAAGYSGMEFPLLTGWRPSGLGGFNAVRRWILFRESRVQPEETRAILWFDRSSGSRPAGPR